MTRIAMTLWQERIAPLFDTAGALLILDVNTSEQGEAFVAQSRDALFPQDRRSCCGRIDFLRMLGVQTLICGAISQGMEMTAKSAGIEVFGFRRGSSDEVLQAYLMGRLEDEYFTMPGCQSGGGLRRCHRNGPGPGHRGG